VLLLASPGAGANLPIEVHPNFPSMSSGPQGRVCPPSIRPSLVSKGRRLLVVAARCPNRRCSPARLLHCCADPRAPNRPTPPISSSDITTDRRLLPLPRASAAHGRSPSCSDLRDFGRRRTRPWMTLDLGEESRANKRAKPFFYLSHHTNR
jgi:hypothetical protein